MYVVAIQAGDKERGVVSASKTMDEAIRDAIRHAQSSEGLEWTPVGCLYVPESLDEKGKLRAIFDWYLSTHGGE